MNLLSLFFGGESPLRRSSSTFTIDVPLQEEPLTKREYLLEFAYMSSFIQAHLFKRHPNQVCPFFDLRYVVDINSPKKEGYLEMEYSTETPDSFVQRMKECTKRFIVISFSIYEMTGRWSDGTAKTRNGHQNVIVVDSFTKTAERYEPHHIAEYDDPLQFYDPRDLDAKLQEFFSRIGYTYVAPMDYCINIPSLQIRFNKFPTGLCVVFSFLYAEYRIRYPEDPRSEILQKIYDKLLGLQVEGKLVDYLGGYIRKIQTFAARYAGKRGEDLSTSSFSTKKSLSQRARTAGLAKEKKAFETVGAYGGPIQEVYEPVYEPTVPYDAEFMESLSGIVSEIFAMYHTMFVTNPKMQQKYDLSKKSPEEVVGLVLQRLPSKVRDTFQIILEHEQYSNQLTFLQLEHFIEFLMTTTMPMEWKQQLIQVVEGYYPEIVEHALGSPECSQRLLQYMAQFDRNLRKKCSCSASEE